MVAGLDSTTTSLGKISAACVTLLSRDFIIITEMGFSACGTDQMALVTEAPPISYDNVGNRGKHGFSTIGPLPMAHYHNGVIMGTSCISITG